MKLTHHALLFFPMLFHLDPLPSFCTMSVKTLLVLENTDKYFHGWAQYYIAPNLCQSVLKLHILFSKCSWETLLCTIIKPILQIGKLSHGKQGKGLLIECWIYNVSETGIEGLKQRKRKSLCACSFWRYQLASWLNKGTHFLSEPPIFHL